MTETVYWKAILQSLRSCQVKIDPRAIALIESLTGPTMQEISSAIIDLQDSLSSTEEKDPTDNGRLTRAISALRMLGSEIRQEGESL